MSAYTTLYVTRAKALRTIFEAKYGEFSDEWLEEEMDKLLKARLYNCRIVDDMFRHNDDDQV